MKVCVQGMWHLGCVTAAALASVGHEVIGLDFDAEVVRNLAVGKPPIFEPGLAELVAEGMAKGCLRFSSSIDDLPTDLEILWLAYDTPVDEDDSADVEFVISELSKVLPRLPEQTTIIVSSQMPVGSIRRLEAIASRLCPEKVLEFAYSPENLRLGKALDVFLRPDRVVVGARTEFGRSRIDLLLRAFTDRIEWMSVESAEMTKHAINAFLAVSVVFANEIASVCEQVGADAKEVERGLKTEARIGSKAYVGPGTAFAGGTLARDIEFLRQTMREQPQVISLLRSVRTSNDAHKRWAERKLVSVAPIVEGKRVTVWGLTYKPGTDTLRRSMSVELCDWLISKGAVLSVHDPAVSSFPPNWTDRVKIYTNPLSALEDAQILIVGTQWEEYKLFTANQIVEINPGLIVIDPNRFLVHLQRVAQIQYFAVGTPNHQEN